MAVTMNDVAREAKVSRALVSLVFRDSPKVSARSRKKVLAAAEKLGYRPNALARSLASRSTQTFGVLLNDITNPFFAEIYETIALSCEQAGYQILMGAGQRSIARENAIIGNFLSHQVDGLILVAPRMTAQQLGNLPSHTVLVIIGKNVNIPNADSVLNDEYVGARLAIDHLYGLGHRKIAHVSGGSGAGASDRKAGYVAAMSGVGLKNNVDTVLGDFTEQAGKHAAKILLQRNELPTAIFAANDLVAVGLIAGFREQGIRVPEDVSVVGYDNSSLSGLSLVSLTTIEQPLAELGLAATELILERIAGRTNRVVREFPPKLVIRDSTAAPRTHAMKKPAKKTAAK